MVEQRTLPQKLLNPKNNFYKKYLEIKDNNTFLNSKLMEAY